MGEKIEKAARPRTSTSAFAHAHEKVLITSSASAQSVAVRSKAFHAERTKQTTLCGKCERSSYEAAGRYETIPYAMAVHERSSMAGGSRRADTPGISRRGFVVLAASALGSFFIKPDSTRAGGSAYLMTVSSVGYGYGWDDWQEETGAMPEPSARERARESIGEGSVLGFEHNPAAPLDEPWLLATFEGDPVCELPFRAVPEEIAATQVIYDAMKRSSGAVWALVTSVKHKTYADYGRSERVHEMEFDVFVSA